MLHFQPLHNCFINLDCVSPPPFPSWSGGSQPSQFLLLRWLCKWMLSAMYFLKYNLLFDVEGGKPPTISNSSKWFGLTLNYGVSLIIFPTPALPYKHYVPQISDSALWSAQEKPGGPHSCVLTVCRRQTACASVSLIHSQLHNWGLCS